MCWLLLENNNKFWVCNPGWERVCPWFQKSDMPVGIRFSTIYRWRSSSNCFTGQTLIALRSRVAVSGLLKQVKPFSKNSQLCWCVLSLLAFFILFFYFIFLQSTKDWLLGRIHEPSETVQQILLALLPDWCISIVSSPEVDRPSYLLAFSSTLWQGSWCDFSPF